MRDQEVGMDGRLEVERRDGGGMDSSVGIAKDLIDVGLGVGDSLFHDVEIWGSGADMGHSTSKTSNDDAHELTTPTTITTIKQ